MSLSWQRSGKHWSRRVQPSNKYEEHTIRKLAALIFVEHREFIKAKLRVQDAMNSQS